MWIDLFFDASVSIRQSKGTNEGVIRKLSNIFNRVTALKNNYGLTSFMFVRSDSNDLVTKNLLSSK